MNILLTHVQTTLRLEDIEGYIKIHGAPDDEYDSEAKELASALATLSEDKLTEETIVAVISLIWEKSFNLDVSDIKKRLAAFHRVARKLLPK